MKAFFDRLYHSFSNGIVPGGLFSAKDPGGPVFRSIFFNLGPIGVFELPGGCFECSGTITEDSGRVSSSGNHSAKCLERVFGHHAIEQF